MTMGNEGGTMVGSAWKLQALLEEDVFYLTSKEARITFTRDEDGQVTGMTIVTPGPTFTGTRF